MWTHQETVATSAAPDAVWRLWSDVSGWSDWDEDIEWSRLDGRFETGARGKMKPRGVPPSNFRLASVVQGRSYTVESRLPLGKLEFHHELGTGADGGTTFSHRATFSGPLSPFYGRVFGRKMQKNFRGIMQCLARKAEGT
jgi:Polyketide cyclase / dehydrase and lipid transport